MAYNKQQIETIFNTICERIEEGESLRSVLSDDNMPSSQTFYIWLDDSEDKSKQYARCTSMRADAMFDEMITIAHTPKMGVEKTIKANGDIDRKEGDMLGHRRLEVDAIKWALSKLNPKKYGDKIQTEHSGEIKGNSHNHTYEEMYFLKYGKKPE